MLKKIIWYGFCINIDMTKKVYKAISKIVKTKLKTSSGCT